MFKVFSVVFEFCLEYVNVDLILKVCFEKGYDIS